MPNCELHSHPPGIQPYPWVATDVHIFRRPRGVLAAIRRQPVDYALFHLVQSADPPRSASVILAPSGGGLVPYIEQLGLTRSSVWH